MTNAEFFLDAAHERESDVDYNGEMDEETRKFFPAYIFYRKSLDEKGKHVGWCSMCGEFVNEDCFEEFEAKTSKLHNYETACPYCGRGVTLKSEGKMRSYNSLCTKRNIAYFYSPEPNLVYIRVFAMWADYSDTSEPFPRFHKIWKSEQARYRLRPGEWISERHDWYGNMHSTKEPYEAPSSSPDSINGLCCAEKVLKNSFLKYHQLGEYYAHADDRVYRKRYVYYRDIEYKPMRYLCYFTMYPQLEMVAKLGLTWAVSDLVNERRKNARLLNWNAKKPHEFLRLTKAQANEYLKEYALSKEILGIVQRGKGAISLKLAAAIDRAVGDRANELLSFMFKYNLTFEKVSTYVNGRGADLLYYLDYIKAAETVGYYLSVHNVLFPKVLREAHDAAVAGVTVVKYRQLNKRKQTALKKRAKRYEYTICGCTFIFPLSGDEIVQEGKNLGHCVGGYAARHIDGKTNIVFMRRASEPDKSWYTIEIDGTKVRQAYGKGNRIEPQDDKEACRAFHLWRCHLEHKVKRFAGSFKNMRYIKIA